MGPGMNAKTDESAAEQLKQARAVALYGDDALIDGEACAAGGNASLSYWNDEVREGRAPKPVICRPRFARWRLGDVRKYWRDASTDGTNDRRASVVEKASDASAKARTRQAATTSSNT
jgi:hypothetical protein